MTFDLLRAVLRGLFWGLLYIGTICAAILAFAPLGLPLHGGAIGCLAVALDSVRRFRLPPSGAGGERK